MPEGPQSRGSASVEGAVAVHQHHRPAGRDAPVERPGLGALDLVGELEVLHDHTAAVLVTA